MKLLLLLGVIAGLAVANDYVSFRVGTVEDGVVTSWVVDNVIVASSDTIAGRTDGPWYPVAPSTVSRGFVSDGLHITPPPAPAISTGTYEVAVSSPDVDGLTLKLLAGTITDQEKADLAAAIAARLAAKGGR